jgi:DNA recombination protein RmuC
MNDILFLGLGLALGVALGWLIGRRRDTGGADGAARLAAAEAREQELRAQLESANREREQREARDEGENRLLKELAPVKDRLEQMQTAVQRLERERTEQYSTIQEQLRAAIESDETLRKQTQALAQALSSNNLRGVWGEAQLRKLVELAGLIKHADFDEQATISTDGGSGRADMVINLPGGKSLAIDSKVPFNSYQEASTISELATGEELARRQRLLDEHVKAMRSHVDALGSKAYWTGLETSPDFVIAFVPSESLLSAALDADASLLEYAFKKNVALASPVSLFSVLKTINYIWRQNADENQVRSMIRIGHELYERVGRLAQLADKLGRSISGSVRDYNAFVSSFESRMLVSARRLNDLDENELAIGSIESPKPIDEQASAITAKELTEETN